MQSISMSSISTSFTANSSNNNLADIAARVVQEFRNENGEEDDIYDDDFTDNGNRFYVPSDNEKILNENEANSNSDSDEEFEFDVVRTTQSHDSSPVSADQILSNGEIVTRYPLFDRSLLLDNDVVPNFYKISDNLNSNSVANFKASPAPVVRVPLRKLFSEEQRDSPSCSSSEADDLDGITPGTYCIWKPKAEESPGRCKKSNSTGNSSKRWKFRNFLHRSNSDNNFTHNKDSSSSVVVFNPVTESKKKTNRSDQKVKKLEKTSKVAVADGGDFDGGDTTAPATVTIENNSANKSNKGGNNNRLRSYLPYKQDLVGVFANVNGLSRNLHPF